MWGCLCMHFPFLIIYICSLLFKQHWTGIYMSMPAIWPVVFISVQPLVVYRVPKPVIYLYPDLLLVKKMQRSNRQNNKEVPMEFILGYEFNRHGATIYNSLNHERNREITSRMGKGKWNYKQDIPYLLRIKIHAPDSNAFHAHYPPKHQNHDPRGWSPRTLLGNLETTNRLPVCVMRTMRSREASYGARKASIIVNIAF